MPAASWKSFRKLDIAGRRAALPELLPAGCDDSLAADGLALSVSAGDAGLAFADAMVENAIGFMPVPLGFATGFLVDGRAMALPLATEEPSVIAAASFAATIAARHGGFTTEGGDPVMTAQVFLAPPPGLGAAGRAGLADRVRAAASELAATLAPVLASMEKRGGGYRGLEAAWVETAPAEWTLRVDCAVDVRDAMGANLLNTCAELLRAPLEALTGGSVLMAILSNQARGRLTRARCAIPVDELVRGTWRGRPFAERIAWAARIALADPSRAVTHNKGIMNGISALALATGNDTRAIEAAAHAWASRDGQYRSLSTWTVEGDNLVGTLELPLPFATVGGAAGCHPVARLGLAAAGITGATALARAAAALGLAQNFAALQALAGEGIQAGHMRLHARRAAWNRPALDAAAPAADAAASPASPEEPS